MATAERMRAPLEHPAEKALKPGALGLVSTTRFAGFLARPDVCAGRLADLSRPLLERYLADLALDPRAVRSSNRDIASYAPFWNPARVQAQRPARRSVANFRARARADLIIRRS